MFRDVSEDSSASYRLESSINRLANKLLPAPPSLQGVTFPAMMSMWARWAPPLERSRLMTLSGAGGNFGAFVTLPLTGYLCQTLGWPAVFYLCGEGI